MGSTRQDRNLWQCHDALNLQVEYSYQTRQMNSSASLASNNIHTLKTLPVRAGWLPSSFTRPLLA
jgi:hypothetical protein